MALDVYDPCPCGSGKKLKFCCQALVGDMQKVLSLQRNNQPRAALQMLQKLEASYPGNAWVATTQAVLLLGERRDAEAKQILESLMASNPDHLFGLVLYATAAFSMDGYDASKAIIHRAFQRCLRIFPDMIGDLAMAIAAVMQDSDRYLAARQHLALALRLFSDDQRREQVFYALLHFDGDSDVPYPLRSVHQLAEVSATDEDDRQNVEKAERLCDLGCWGPAGRIFNKLIERHPDDAALWQNLGLCRAWDGNESAAAEAWHRSAQLQDDFDTAVECETMAQLLDLNATEDRRNVITRKFGVKSVSSLLTSLDQAERFLRIELPPEDDESPEGLPDAYYEILDRPLPNGQQGETLTRESVPHVLCQLSVYDRSDDDEPAEAYLTGLEGDPFESSRALFEDVAADKVEPEPDDSSAQTDVLGVPNDLFPLQWRWAFPERTPAIVRRQLEHEQWQHVVADVWTNSPLSALGGNTPHEAAENADLKIPLMAAVYVLDSYCEQNGYSLDVEPVCDRLKLPKPRPIEVTEDVPLNALSAMQLHRLPVDQLSDDQLAQTFNRAMLIHHSRFLDKILREIESRPTCAEKVDLHRVYLALVDLARQRNEREEALRWIAKGREHAQTTDKAFQNALQWGLREAALRLEDPQDPQLAPHLTHLAEFYGSKVPQLRERLTLLCQAYGITPPWQTHGVGAEAASGAVGRRGIWTPSDSDEPPAGDKKLWIPGQD